MTQFDPNNLNGVIPAMITSFNKDESINKEGIRKTVNYLISENVDGLYITGSTGETFLMSQEEKKQAIEIIVEEVNGRVPVIAHIGSIGTKITTELGQYAEKVGVDALSALPPFYYGFSNDEIFNYYKDISNSTNLPITVYNISHANLMDLDMLKRLSSIKNVKGVKYTAPTHFNFSKIKKEIGESFKIYSGMDEMALSGLISGADGIIGSFYNLMPELFVEIYKQVKNNQINEAKKILAFEVTKICRGIKSANEAEDIAKNLFSIKKIDDRLPSYEIQSTFLTSSKFSILDALEKLNLSKSRSDTKRLIKSKGIKINEEIYNSNDLSLKIYANKPELKISVGKKNIGILKIKK